MYSGPMDDVAEERTIEQIVGRNIRRARERTGLTLSEISKELRGYGISWSTGRLGDIEAGRGTASVQVVVMLALVLSSLGGSVVRPVDLLHAEVPVLIGPGHAMRPGPFNELVEQGLPDAEVGMFTDSEVRLRSAFSSMYDALEGIGTVVSLAQAGKAIETFSDADYRNARRLQVDRNAYIGACLRLWGRLLSEETEARAPEGASPQKKGRITRELLGSLRGQLRVDAGDARPSEYERVTVSEGDSAKIHRKTPKTFLRYKAPHDAGK